METTHEMRGGAAAGALAGLVGGVVLSLVMTLLSISSGADVWIGAKVAGAPFLGERAFQPGFDGAAVLVGLLCHFGVSIAWGTAFGVLFDGLSGTATVLVGLAWGVVVLIGMYYVVLPLAELRQLAASTPVARAVTQHLLFGFSVALAFLGFRNEQTRSPAMSPRIEPGWPDTTRGRGTAA